MRQFAVFCLLVFCLPVSAEVHSSDFTEPWQIYAHGLLRDSVAFRSVHGEKQVVPFTEFLANEFIEAGFRSRDVRVLPMDSAGEPSASLVVRYRGTSKKRPILFAAHMDVVPATATAWDRDPFKLSEDDGFYYGRGVLDDKYGITVLTTTFLRLMSEGFEPERDLIIAFSGDEETEQLTIKSLTENHLDLIDADIAFNVDVGFGRLDKQFNPAAIFLQFAEKTYVTFEFSSSNAGGHSSKPPPENAIADLARAITAIHEYDFPVRSSDDSRAYFAAMSDFVDNELGDAMRRFAENPDDKEASDYLSNDPEYVGIVRTTCVPTMLRGGHVENALPESATVTVNCRVYPGDEISDVQTTLKRIIDDPDITHVMLGDPVASPPSSVRDEISSLVESAIHRQFPEVKVIPYIAAYGTDGIYLRRAGITTYGLNGVFLRAEDEHLHASNEKLPIKSFFDSLEFWHGMIKGASGL